jgi:hypothetical protein
MAAKQSGSRGIVLYAVFTSFLAPLLVHQLTDNHPHRELPLQAPVSLTEWNDASPRPAPDPEERIIAQGMGRTAEEAWYDALRSALRMSTAALVDPKTWNQDGNSISAAVLGDTRGLVTRCEELRCVCERGVWRREVAVFVARTTLAARLRAMGVPLTSATS